MKKEICHCSLCDRMLYEGDALADHKVYKYGELDEIPLAHRACAARDNQSRGENFWEFDA